MLESRLDPFVRRHEKLKGPKGLSQKVRDIRSHSQPGFSKTMHATAWNHTRLICFHPSFWRNSLLLAHVVTTTTVPCHQWREFPWYQATSDCCWQTSEQKECGSYHGFWWVLKDPLKGLASSETFTTSYPTAAYASTARAIHSEPQTVELQPPSNTAQTPSSFQMSTTRKAGPTIWSSMGDSATAMKQCSGSASRTASMAFARIP